jgi:hypothetical protein
LFSVSFLPGKITRTLSDQDHSSFVDPILKRTEQILLEKISYSEASLMVTLCSFSSTYNNRYLHAMTIAGRMDSGAIEGNREMCVCVCVCALVCVCVHARCSVCPPLSYLRRMPNSKEFNFKCGSDVRGRFSSGSGTNRFYFLAIIAPPLPKPPLCLPVSWPLSRNTRSCPSHRPRSVCPSRAVRCPSAAPRRRRTPALAYTNSEELRLCLP